MYQVIRNGRLSAAVVVCTSIILMTACSSHQKEEEERITNQIRARVALMEQQRSTRYVNSNWYVDCAVDAVSAVRRCYASTFGKSLGHDGEPYGSNIIPFKVVYVDKSGPYVEVGVHDFPGRTPTVRIDDNKPVSVQDYGGVQAPSPDPLLVQQMLSGRVTRATYHVWPKGPEQMYVDISGFDQAWQRLNIVRNQ